MAEHLAEEFSLERLATAGLTVSAALSDGKVIDWMEKVSDEQYRK